MSVCKIDVEVRVDDAVIKTKIWPACDIMKTAPTRAWATRQFNAFLKDFSECDIGRDKIITVTWTARYGAEQGFGHSNGYLSGVNGKALSRRGIFED